MTEVCSNCGRPIRVMAFRGTEWCSDDCRKVLLGKVKCSYGHVQVQIMSSRGPHSDQLIAICVVHNSPSRYGEEKGEHRPCALAETM